MVATWNIAADAAYYPREAEGDVRGSYYHGGKEPAGRWYAPAGDFGLTDDTQVDANLFQRLYAGIAADGKSLISSARGRVADRVPAYDVTFSASRSVSLIWAFASPELRAAIEQAHHRAARAALNLLEREGTYARRGHNGERVERVGLTAALFQHGESRPCEHADGQIFGDPNLHLHCVIYNLATRADGTVGSLHSMVQRDLKKCLGATMHAALSSELQALGFEIDRIGANGIFEIAGVEASYIEYFSARRNEIERELEKHGVTSQDAVALAAAVAKATRGAKNEAASARRERTWTDAAIAHGIDVANFSASLRQADRILDLETGEKLFAERLAELPRALTDSQSVFDRKDLLQAIAVALVGTGLPVTRIDAEVERFIDAQAVVEIGRDKLDRPRYSTPEIVRIEREVVARATRLAEREGFALDRGEMRAHCANAGLSAEQTDAALAVTDGGHIAVMSGAPGSGKTTALSPIVARSRAAGHRVLGGAASWRTATALKNELAIPSRALASWLEKARRGGEFLKPNDVLVIDEAGLINARDMHAVLTQVEQAGAKVILVGDSRQLQAIGGPGLGLVQRAIESARVETIVRQKEQWQRDAIWAFGDGRAHEALQAFAEHGHVVEADGAKAAIGAMVAHWNVARTVDPSRAPLLLARTNADVAAISRAVREVLRSEGQITGPEVTFKTVTPSGQTSSIALAKGDKVRFLTRDDHLHVINGTTGTILGVKQVSIGKAPGKASIRIAAEVDGRRIEFAPEDLADRNGRARLGWAFASSVYQSQGMTVDRAIVLVDPSFDRHQIYVASSRAREATTFVVDGKAIDRRLAADLPLDQQNHEIEFAPDDRAAWLAKRLSRAHAQETTLDVLTATREPIETQRRHDATLSSRQGQELAKKTRSRSRERSLD